MSPHLAVNAIAAVSLYLAGVAAALAGLRGRPAVARRTVCRLGLLGALAVLAGALLVSALVPSAGWIRLPSAGSPATVSAPEPPDEEKGSGAFSWDASDSSSRAPRWAVLTPSPSMATQTTRGHATWTTAWAWAMLAGSALLLGGLAARMVRLARWRRTWRPARGDWRALVRRAARDVGMDRPFGVFVASGLSQPAATGILAPAVVLPESHAALSAPVARAVLAHELAHLKDRDPLWALIGHAMVAATWWCPLSWRLRRRAKRESELTADDHALAAGVSARDLAGALAGFAEQDNLRGVPATVSGMACHLTRRIEMILRSNQPHCPKMSRASRAVLSATACLLAAVLAAAPLTGVARGEAASKPATEGKDTSTRPAREGEATRPAREGDRRDGDPVPVDRTLKGMPAELADMARPILLAREEAIAQANRRAAEGLLALAARAEVSGDRDGAIRLWLLVVRISPKNEQAVAALRRAGVNPSAEGPPKAGGKDGEGPRRIGPPDGGGPAREAPKEAPKEGAAPAREGQRENEGASRPAPKDGEGAVRTAPREGG